MWIFNVCTSLQFLVKVIRSTHLQEVQALALVACHFQSRRPFLSPFPEIPGTWDRETDRHTDTHIHILLTPWLALQDISYKWSTNAQVIFSNSLTTILQTDHPNKNVIHEPKGWNLLEQQRIHVHMMAGMHILRLYSVWSNCGRTRRCKQTQHVRKMQYWQDSRGAITRNNSDLKTQ